MIKFEFHEKLDQKTIDSLWEQVVDMDDWDYVLFVPKSFRDKFKRLEEDDYSRGNLTPKSYEVEGLLHGCCHNAWYEVTDFKGRAGVLGVAYHS